ncbi:hypothetical protein IFVP18_C280246 [Vibrio parahaemolyticus]
MTFLCALILVGSKESLPHSAEVKDISVLSTLENIGRFYGI